VISLYGGKHYTIKTNLQRTVHFPVCNATRTKQLKARHFFINRSCFSIYNSITSIWMKSKFALLSNQNLLPYILLDVLKKSYVQLQNRSVTRGNSDTHIFLFQTMYYPIFWCIISYFQSKYSKYIHLFRTKHVENSNYIGHAMFFLLLNFITKFLV
jgi:hypothetical protein